MTANAAVRENMGMDRFLVRDRKGDGVSKVAVGLNGFAVDACGSLLLEMVTE